VMPSGRSGEHAGAVIAAGDAVPPAPDLEAEARAKAAAEAKAEAEAATKAEAKAAAAAQAAAEANAEEEARAAAKAAERAAELERVRQAAAALDIASLGAVSSASLSAPVEAGATRLPMADVAQFPTQGTGVISDDAGPLTIAWKGHENGALVGVSGVSRAVGLPATLVVSNSLSDIKGIGPFIEEKLNMLGITTYAQLAEMDDEMMDRVNQAIEFFPGRIKRDRWVEQARGKVEQTDADANDASESDLP
jgi:predicted flap endonuclease-1-like 5' DNA nuclease